MKKVLVLALFPFAAFAFRPPAVPLVQCDPFFSVWSAGDRLTDVETTHWSGAKQPISVTLEADGKTYRLCGTEPASVPALPQTGLEVRPTQTVYTFAEGELKATLTWSTPKLPEDLEVFSRPVTYVTARVTGAKNWKLNAAISPALATNDDKAPMVTNTCTVADLPAMSIGRREQTPLSRSGDRVRCDWGYAWLVGPSAVLDGEAHVLLAYDDVKSIQFFNDDLPAWWRRNGLSFEAMLEQAESDRVALLRKLDAFDAEFSADLLKLGGEDYARLGALAYRQSFAACKLVADKNNQPLYFSKENASNGCIGTVDVFYPQFPHLLLMSPTLARATLAPILIYASHPRWPWPFAPHDVGQYPLANKQCYAGGEMGKDETKLMPVEECGNMLVCLGALAHMEGNADFAGGWWPTVTKWAEYLTKFGFDPGNQLCTDDFAGHLAHNANLAVKTVMGLASYAKMAEMRGETEVAAKYNALARDMVPKWIEAAKGGREGSYRLAYDQPDSWSMKYNLVWDRILGFNLFPPEVAEAEMKAYRALIQPYGLPLDSRKTWTKTDWEIWSATLRNRKEDVAFISAAICRFLDKTPDRIPFSDWYWADSGKFRGFIARSVIGGVFIPALYDPEMWKKYSSRDTSTTRLYAPLKDLSALRTKSVVPEGRTSASIQWRYTLEEPSEGWERPDFDDSAWNVGPGGFGGGGAPGTTIRTPWKTSKIWLRRHVNLAQVPVEAFLSMHHDENTSVWFNGVLAGTYTGYTTDYEIYGVMKESVAALKTGDNLLASVTTQTIGGQYIDLGLSAATEEEAFNLATFNIRCPYDKAENAWSNRLPRVVKVVKDHDFAIMGLQEATHGQRNDLLAALPDWAMIGEGRDNDGKGEASCIFYRKDRFECLATDTFWLSETPRVPASKSWNTACTRVCTWGLFKDRFTGKTFRYFNTHLDHISSQARVEGMKMILHEMGQIAQGETVFLTGDLNDSFERIPADEQKKLLKGCGPQISKSISFEHPIFAASLALYDTFLRTEKPHEGPVRTFHAYQPEPMCRLDYVFATGNVRVLRHVTCNDRPDGKFPSDHDAVFARLLIR